MDVQRGFPKITVYISPPFAWALEWECDATELTQALGRFSNFDSLSKYLILISSASRFVFA